MFIVPRPAVAVITALVVAWLLPQLVDHWINDAPDTMQTAGLSESGVARLAKSE